MQLSSKGRILLGIILIIFTLLLIKCFLIINEPYEDISKATVKANENKNCSNNTEVISVCMNKDVCCGSNNMNSTFNSQCYCIHPLVKDCNTKYKACVDDNGGNETDDCNNILKQCCGTYSNTNIMSSNFNKPISQQQDTNVLCSITGLGNLGERCMELCQTNNNCKAYSIGYGKCNLFSSINPVANDKNNDIKYVTKI